MCYCQLFFLCFKFDLYNIQLTEIRTFYTAKAGWQGVVSNYTLDESVEETDVVAQSPQYFCALHLSPFTTR